MYDGSDYDDAIENVVGMIEDLDCQVGPQDVGGEDGERLTRVRFNVPEGPTFFLEAIEGSRYFYIKSYFNLVLEIWSRLNEGTVHEIRESDEAHEYDDEELGQLFGEPVTLVDEERWKEATEQSDNEDAADSKTDQESEENQDDEFLVWRDQIAAALDLVDSINPDTEQEIIYNLVEIFSNPAVKFRIDTTPRNGLLGITVRERIFPYEDDFSITTLNRDIVRVRIPANMGEAFLKYTFDLGIRHDGVDHGEPPLAITSESVPATSGRDVQ